MANEVNDPFELRCAIDFESDREATEAAFVEVERRVNPSTTEAQARARVKEVLAGTSSATLREQQWEMAFKIWRALSQRTAMCCFAGTPESTLMWSHYAAGHTGVAIEVEPIGFDKYVHAVTYSSELSPLPLKELVGIEPGSALFNSLFLRKAPCWEYEHEYRTMRFALRSRAFTFGKGSIKRVIVGCAMSPESKLQLLTWMKASAPNIQIAAALPSQDGTYSLQVVDLAELDADAIPTNAIPNPPKFRQRWLWWSIFAGIAAIAVAVWRR